jgi:hypothetical protein
MTFLETALQCAVRGWHVFPLVPRDKYPRIAKKDGGRGFHDGTTSEEQIRTWWAAYPTSNVGIACGMSGLLVYDVDTGLRDDAHFEDWRIRNGLPETYTVRTGKRPEFRVQMYYLGSAKDGKFDLDGCCGDIKSEGGLVLAVGSVHPDGAEYEVLRDKELVAAPAVIEASRRKKVVANANVPVPALGPGEGRHDYLIQRLGQEFSKGWGREVLLSKLEEWNNGFAVPYGFEHLEAMLESAFANFEEPKPEGKVIIGNTAAPPEPASLTERKRPTYPIEVWDGTAVGEFAKLCAADNNIPRKIYAESFRCVLGAVVGDRISCLGVDGALPRSYTIILAPKGKGKGTGIRRAVRFFSQAWTSAMTTVTPGLLFGERNSMWKPKGIGAWIAAASSVPGMANLTKDIKNTPIHMSWGDTLPRILSVHEEMKTFLSTLFIKGGVGSGMEGVICQLWDDVSFNGTATGGRDAQYGEMMFSLLAGVTEEDWFDILSQGNAVGGGMMSRFNLIGTEGNYENVSRMSPPDFTALRGTFLPRIRLLEDAHARLQPTEGADNVISEWQDSLPEGSERMNIHVWRSALMLAWLRHEDAITAKTAGDAVRLGQYQIASHDYYRTKTVENPVAKVQARIVRALEMRGPLTKRELQKYTNAHREGTDVWNRGLDGLVRDRSVGKGEDGNYYMARD